MLNSTVPGAVDQPRVHDEVRGLIWARPSTLVRIADPLDADIWAGGPITRAAVLSALADRPRVAAVSGGPCRECGADPFAFREHDPLLRHGCRSCDIDRVVYWSEVFGSDGPDVADPHPVTLDVGFGYFIPDWPVVDGNHRLAAAAVAPVALLPVAVVGDWDRGVELLVDEVDASGLFFG